MNCLRCGGLLIEERDEPDSEGWKCVNCGAHMPKFKSEEGRQRWLAAMAARRKKSESGSTVGSGRIAAAIEEIESKIAALEAVKRALLHAQELVNL